MCLYKDHPHSVCVFLDECMNDPDPGKWSGARQTMMRLLHPGPNAPLCTEVLCRARIIRNDDIRMYTQGAYITHRGKEVLVNTKRVGFCGDGKAQVGPRMRADAGLHG